MKKLYVYTLVALAGTFSSCEDFVTLDSSATQVSNKQVFGDERMVRAAIAGMYSELTASNSFAGGTTQTVTFATSLLSDELMNRTTTPDFVSLNDNSVVSLSGPVQSIWSELYNTIYVANSIIEGTEGNKALADDFKMQTIAQAKFVRAFCYFYLCNLWGDVPLLLTTDYRVNGVASRTAISEVYAQMERDLLEAANGLPDDFSLSADERTIPSRYAAFALLARVNLYSGKWSEAEANASRLIGNSLFSLSQLDKVFLKNSTEAIWQLKTGDPTYNTRECPMMVAISSSGRVTLTDQLLGSFEPGDLRRSTWVGLFQDASVTINFPAKYKVNRRRQPITEYYMVMRLAEQYLIRAEARAKQGDLRGSVSDLNAVRVRSSLPALNESGMSKDDVLNAIYQERRVELFAEWGHRWFDLIRTQKIDAALGYKPDWESNDAKLPIPLSEITVNPNLKQNE